MPSGHPPVVAFNMAGPWKDRCLNEHRPGFAPHWQGQNWCWEYMKHEGCYASGGILTWREAQEMVARQQLAPPPEEFLMSPLHNPGLCEHNWLGAELNVPDAVLQAATSWFNSNVDVFVINLDEDDLRLAAISDHLQVLQIPFTRMPGLDMRKKGAYEEAKRLGQVPANFNFDLAQSIASTDFNQMGGITGTVGCAAAHLKTMRHIASESKKPLALVLEDDTLLAEDFVIKLALLLASEAPCDWEAISLKTRCPYGGCVSPHLTRVLPDGNEPGERCRHGVNYGFFAMLYRVPTLDRLQTKLAATVWNETQPRCLDIDVALAAISDEVAYYAVPGLQQPGFLQEGMMGSSRGKINWAPLDSKTEDKTTKTFHSMDELMDTLKKAMPFVGDSKAEDA